MRLLLFWVVRTAKRGQRIPIRRGSKSRGVVWQLTDDYGNLNFMGNPAISTALDGLLDPLTRCLDAESSQRVVEFRVDPAVQARVDALAERANDGVLSEEDHAEYEAFINAADFISILKLKARRQLNAQG